ncbi:hypothetical protein [Aeromonas sp. SCS5]|uniref:hypothetical protein n=1 Tax=Aeromonas sp. SCS5 TaxID=1519205 RepID=UPI0009036F0E|nr:hypothetical protein [Aeromonas sp. SCS5]
MLISKEYLTVLGPIVAAIIAGSISFIATVLSKDQKTSEFRQVWIDSLRDEISDLLAISNTLLAVISRKEHEGESQENILEYMYERQDDIMKMSALITKIELRLNPKEHSKFIYMLNTLRDFAHEQSIEENEIDAKKIVIESQKILKKEWTRVKSGELSFRLIKWGSLTVFLISSFGAALYVSEHIVITYVP